MSRPVIFKFQLFVAGNAQNAVQAIANLRSLCQGHLPGRHQIEIIDVFKDPNRALADGIYLTPTLIKIWPRPVVKIVGTLSQTQIVTQVIGLDERI